MARQFSSNDIVRLLLNVERSVVREALTDERLSAHEIWLDKGEILEAIAAIGGIAGEIETPREAFVEIFAAVVRAGLGAARILRDQATGPVIGRLFRLAMDGVIVILEHILDSLESLAVPPSGDINVAEFPLIPPVSGAEPIKHSVSDLNRAITALDRQQKVLETARRRVQELFLEIDPVFSLAQGPIISDLSSAEDDRAVAASEIIQHLAR